MTRGTKLFVRGYDGRACGPFRWTALREWTAVGYFTRDDEVRSVEQLTWSPIGTFPELLATPPSGDTDQVLNDLRHRARENKAVGPRAAAYLARLGCPVRPERLNPYTAFQWVRIMEELNPPLADVTEHWAAEEESNERVPSATPESATAAQIEMLRALKRPVSGRPTRLEAHRLIAGPPTDEQIRQLKFHGIPLPEGACKDEASELIDQHMRENWGAEEAYQASRRRLGPEGAEGQKPSAAWKLREVPLPPSAKVVPAPHAPPLFPPSSPAPPSSDPPPQRSTGTGFRVALFLVGIGIVLAAGLIVRKKLEADAIQSAKDSVELQKREAPAPEARPARAVIILAAPNLVLGEKLRTLVESLQLTGIVGGPEPRVLIDGRLYRVGDGIDPSRGVVIVQVDVNKNAVVFSDAAGNVVQRILE